MGRIGLDLIAERGRIVPIDGIKKNIVGCNWKLAVDNVFDYYHAPLTHASTMMVRQAALLTGMAIQSRTAAILGGSVRIMLGAYGNAISGPIVSDNERADFRGPGGRSSRDPQNGFRLAR